MAGRSKQKRPSGPGGPIDPSIFDQGLDGYLEFTNEILWQAYEGEINPNHAGALIRGAKVAAEIWTAKQLLDGTDAGEPGRAIPAPMQLLGPVDEGGAAGRGKGAPRSSTPLFDTESWAPDQQGSFDIEED